MSSPWQLLYLWRPPQVLMRGSTVRSERARRSSKTCVSLCFLLGIVKSGTEHYMPGGLKSKSRRLRLVMYDAIIVGGGPAGLSAALILGRCRRRVVLFDTRQPRNARSRGLHGFLTREGIEPLDLLHIAREQLKPYAIEMREALVVACECYDDGFSVTLEDGSKLRSRKLLLATGVVD